MALGPRLRCAGGVAHAPSLLRHLCWGAHRAAQTAARLRGAPTPGRRLPGTCSSFRAVTRAAVRLLESSTNVGEGGQPRPGLASPSSAPFSGPTDDPGDDVKVSASHMTTCSKAIVRSL